MQAKFTVIMLGLLFSLTNLVAQEIIDFEDFDVPIDSFLNGSDGNGGFTSGNLFLPNSYNPAFDSWSGWSISNKTDTLTPGFMNQHSAITGSGFDNSSNYVVSFGRSIMQLQNEAAGNPVMGMYITNSTYAYLSMRDGDQFAKKFGGVTGDDPDFFLLTVKKYLDGALSQDSINFYLADFRFEDNSQDYIVANWTFVDLSALGAADSLVFTLTSSDVGQFGVNTPGYFCVDNVSVNGMLTSTFSSVANAAFKVYPNPTVEDIRIQHNFGDSAHCRILDMNGRLLLHRQLSDPDESINLQFLPEGSYVVQVRGKQGAASKILVKQ